MADANKPDKPKQHSFFRRVLFFLKLLEIRLRFVAILVVTALVVGYWDHLQNYYERWQRSRHPEAAPARDAAGESVFEYFCPMHQFVVRDTPGSKCPICGMDLSQRKKGAPVELPEGTLMRVQVSPERIMQAGVQIEPVQYRLLVQTVRSYGTVEPAEPLLAKITARFPGRVEELMVNTTGVVVKKGQPLVRIYSPKFLAATQEYLQALAAQRDAEKDPAATAEDKRRATDIAGYARDRLALAGFTPGQLDTIQSTRKASEYATLEWPLEGEGTVLERNVVRGQVVEEGTTLYNIADLSSVWVQLQILESEIAAVRLGMPVDVEAVAYPATIFYGMVDFIYPTVNPDIRAVKVRVAIPNKDRRLKPGMYVTATIRSTLGRYEEVASDGPAKSDLPPAPAADIYTCPMHPEVVSDKPGGCPKCGMHLEKKPAPKAPRVVYSCSMRCPEGISDKPGKCSKCGMDLEKTIISDDPAAFASLTDRWAEGYDCGMHPEELEMKPGVCRICGCGMPLKRVRIERVPSIPETAVIDTGARYVVYIESMAGVYDAREVKLGRRAGAYYPVLAGLAIGQKIVTRGSFLIDAEARLNPATVAEPKPPAAPAPAAPGEPPKAAAAPPAGHQHPH